MKSLFLFFISSFLFFASLNAQDIMDYKEFYMGAGYNVSYGEFSELNYILDKYNDLGVNTKDFKELHIPNGFALALGTNLAFLNFEFGVATKKQRRLANYIVGDDLYARDVRLNMTSYSLGMGLFTPISRGIGLGIGASYELGNVKVQTKKALNSELGSKDYLDIVKDKTKGITLDFKFQIGDTEENGSKILIKPYYTLSFSSDTDLSPLDATINEGSMPDNTNLNQNFSHFGVRIIVTYSVIR
ncbi:MAG: hypothetical protein ACPG5P_00245 [Saprospiraceae bacterium]